METINVLSLSYGKDSLACLGACEKLGIPIHRIITAEVWATQTIPADLPPMIEFKKKADKIIKERWGIEVEHICATKKVGGGTLEPPTKITSTANVQEKRAETQGRFTASHSKKEIGVREGSNKMLCRKLTYEEKFYQARKKDSRIYGFPYTRMGNGHGRGWCRDLKLSALRRVNKLFLDSPNTRGDIKIVQFLGIASDEPERICRHTKDGIRLPLVEIGWDEATCRKWCEENDLLSPIYTTATRGGCWFCHNQGVPQLRLLRKNYPDLWALLMKWDLDSPVTFKSGGHTIHDFDKRFEMEDKGILSPNDKVFRWSYLENPPTKQTTLFDLISKESNGQTLSTLCGALSRLARPKIQLLLPDKWLLACVRHRIATREYEGSSVEKRAELKG